MISKKISKFDKILELDIGGLFDKFDILLKKWKDFINF